MNFVVKYGSKIKVDDVLRHAAPVVLDLDEDVPALGEVLA